MTKTHDGFSFEIYRKPTATDIIIPNDSCHPREHKTAEISYYFNRMKTYKLTPESRQKERENIRQILVNNKCDASSFKKFNREKTDKDKTTGNKSGQSLRTLENILDLLKNSVTAQM